jgi:hypothetical protein
MLPSVLILLLLAMVVGLVLVIVGIRGRRINDHPVCRQCHFDLQGIYPEVVTCPECGSGLKREHGVRQGARSRMPILAAFGVLLILTPMIPVGAVAFAALTGSDVNSYKPLGLILWEAKRADAATATKLSAELINRILSQKLSPSQYTRVVDTMLAIQGDTSKPWHETWGDVLDRAEFDGVMTPAKKATYEKQAAVLSLKPRRRVSAGGILPVIVALKESRVSSSYYELAYVTLKSATLDNKELERLPEQRAVMDPFGGTGLILGSFDFSGQSRPSDDPFLGTMTIAGSKPNSGFSFRSPFDQTFDGTLAFQLPEGLTPGKHTIVLELELAAFEPGNRAMFIINGRVQRQASDPTQSRTVRLTAEFDVAPAGTPIAKRRVLAKEDLESLANKLRPESLYAPVESRVFIADGRRQRSLQPTGEAFVTFDVAELPVDVAYDVFIRRDGKEELLGSFTSGKQADRDGDTPGRTPIHYSLTVTTNGITQSSSSSSLRNQRMVKGVVSPISSSTVDLVLRPSDAVAASTLDLQEIADGDIVYEGVAVRTTELGVNSMNELLRKQMQQQMDQLIGR